MPTKTQTFLALDVGEKRIGVAKGDTLVRIAVPVTTLENDEQCRDRIYSLLQEYDALALIVGYPRNLSGETTAQTQYVTSFVSNLTLDVPIVYQDESLTSVHAEARLKTEGKPYTKSDIDAFAAVLILQDYMESHV